MKKYLSLLSIVAALAAVATLSACQAPKVRDSVPATEIHGKLGNAPFDFVGPKDLAVESIHISAETNGAVTLDIKNLNAKTNPDIISMSGEAQAKIITAQGDSNAKAFEAGTKAAATIAGAVK